MLTSLPARPGLLQATRDSRGLGGLAGWGHCCRGEAKRAPGLFSLLELHRQASNSVFPSDRVSPPHGRTLTWSFHSLVSLSTLILVKYT